MKSWHIATVLFIRLHRNQQHKIIFFSKEILKYASGMVRLFAMKIQMRLAIVRLQGHGFVPCLLVFQAHCAQTYTVLRFAQERIQPTAHITN